MGDLRTPGCPCLSFLGPQRRICSSFLLPLRPSLPRRHPENASIHDGPKGQRESETTNDLILSRDNAISEGPADQVKIEQSNPEGRGRHACKEASTDHVLRIPRPHPDYPHSLLGRQIRPSGRPTELTL